jgi:hypothetical protein
VLEAFGLGLLGASSLLLARQHPAEHRASADLSASGWSARRVGTLWFWVVLACGIPAALGSRHGPDVRGSGWPSGRPRRGRPVAMLTNSPMPFAFERGARAGAATAVGLCFSLLGSS